MLREFLGGPMVRTVLLLCRAWVQSMVGKLPRSRPKKKKKKTNPPNNNRKNLFLSSMKELKNKTTVLNTF